MVLVVEVRVMPLVLLRDGRGDLGARQDPLRALFDKVMVGSSGVV